MDEMSKDFAIPYYIFEEIVDYVEQNALGKCNNSKWDNIVSLVGLAKVNNRITQQQARFLLEEFNREN